MKHPVYFILASLIATTFPICSMEMETDDYAPGKDWVMIDKNEEKIAAYNPKPWSYFEHSGPTIGRDYVSQIMDQPARHYSTSITEEIQEYLKEDDKNTINDLDSKGGTFLTRAIETFHLPTVQWLLQQPSINTHPTDLKKLLSLLNTEFIGEEPDYIAHVKTWVECIELWEKLHSQETLLDQVNKMDISFEDGRHLISTLKNTVTTSYLIKNILKRNSDSSYTWNPYPKFKHRLENVEPWHCNYKILLIPVVFYFFYINLMYKTA